MKRLAVIVTLSLLASPVIAADATKIDFTQAITDQAGAAYVECEEWSKPVSQQSTCIKQEPLTLGMLALAGLTMQEQGLSGPDQAKHQALGLRIYDRKDAEVSSDDIVLICDQIAKVHYRGIATLRAWQIVCPTRLKN